MTKFPTKVTLKRSFKERIYFDSQFTGVAHHYRGVMVARVGGSWSHCTQSQEAERDES